MAHAQKPHFVFPRNGRVHLNRWGRQFTRLLAAEVCASVWVMLDRPGSEMAWEYWLPTPFASFPFTSPPVRHRVTPCSERALPAAVTASVTSTNTSGLDSSLYTTQEMEMMVVVLSTCRYSFTLHSPENLPIVIIWHCSYAGSQNRKAENFITLFWGVQKRGNNIFCKFVRGFVFLIVRLPQRCLFLWH